MDCHELYISSATTQRAIVGGGEGGRAEGEGGSSALHMICGSVYWVNMKLVLPQQQEKVKNNMAMTDVYSLRNA